MEYYSFEKVLKELQMEEDELKRLVSEGEIRAFRDEDKMKFKKSDIDGLKKGRMTEPTIILPSGDADESAEDSEVLLVEEDTSETLLDIDDLDSADSSSTSVPTVDFSTSSFEDSSASETITEELTFEEDSGSYVLESSDDVLIDSSGELTELDASSQDLAIPTEDIGSESSSFSTSFGDSGTFGDSGAFEDSGTFGDHGDTFIDSETGLQTEPLDIDPDIEAADLDSSFDTDEHIAVDSHDDGPTGVRPRRTTRVIRGSYAPSEPLPPVFSGALVVATIFLMYSGIVMFNLIREVDTPLTSGWTDFLYGMFPTSQYSARSEPSERELKDHLNWRKSIRDGK